ncbi:response regulator [Dorea longicatena]|uniref:response regulator n=1 Tax=Clostridia TaxID=186801 RepID=UPI0011062763|nr:response regulator [Dorea longicatena]MCB6953339.1 response regulator [Dorea longicatena]MCG4676579.1 response regulator [Dorea longicatena]
MEQILILEDDIALNQGLCKALKTENRKIVSCETIKAARDQLLCGCPSLILLDINLPDGSGLDLIVQAKMRNSKYT